MHIVLEDMVVQLSDRRRLAFRGARNVFLECINGLVWLTIEGQQDDIVLNEGEIFRIESNGLAIIQGLPSGSIHMYTINAESSYQGWTIINLFH